MSNQSSMKMSFRPTILALAMMASFQALAIPLPPPTSPIIPTSSDISQNVTNIAPVFNTSNVPTVISASGSSSTFNPLILETGSTVSVTATGAAASVSVSAINASMMFPESQIGNISQIVSNSSTSVPPTGTPVGVNNYFVTVGAPPSTDALVIELGATPVGSSGSIGGLIGIGASVSIAATGAVASVSVSGISTQTVTPGAPDPAAFTLPSIGTVSQVSFLNGNVQPGALNTADVTNIGEIHHVGNIMTGGSASISASGAVGSVGVSIINGDATALAGLPSSGTTLINTSFNNIGQIGQLIANTGNIANAGTISTAGLTTPLWDTSSSVSISGTGAAAAVSMSLINSNGLMPVVATLPTAWTIGPVVQVVGNSGNVVNTGIVTSGLSGEDTNNRPNLGRSASVSIGATGAAASFSISAVSGQLAVPTVSSGQSSITLPGEIGGTVLGLPNPYDLAGLKTGISQAAGNIGAVTNTGTIASLGNLDAGASASVSATGAVTSIGISGNNANLNGSTLNVAGGPSTKIDGTFQASLNVGGVDTISNTGDIYTGNLGHGASVSVGSTGAVASLNVSAIDSSMPALNIGSGRNVFALLEPVINQYDGGDYRTLPPLVRSLLLPLVDAKISLFQLGVNTDNVSNVGKVSVGNLGLGASSSISASGAVTSVSFSAINGSALGSTVLADNSVQNPVTGVSQRAAIEQGSLNLGNVVNSADPLLPVTSPAGMVVGSIGTGASASISASGAVASTSVSFNSSTNRISGFEFGEIVQGALNSGNVTNAQALLGIPVSPLKANVMEVGNLIGTGASASISASGAVASVSFSSVAGALATPTVDPSPGPKFGETFQVAANVLDPTGNYGSPTSAITNVGAITIGGTYTGINSSASVGATGAATSFAVANVADPVIFTGVVTGPITQYAYNAGSVTNSGNIAFTGGTTSLGVGSSVSVSATGAVASTSYRAVNVSYKTPG